MAPARLGPRILRRRDTSHGCQNHTTWPYAARSTPSLDGPGTLPPKSDATRFSIGRRRAVRSLTKPQRARPATTFARPTLPRPPHPAPRLVTIAKRPSVRDGIPEVVWVIWGKSEADY